MVGSSELITLPCLSLPTSREGEGGVGEGERILSVYDVTASTLTLHYTTLVSRERVEWSGVGTSSESSKVCMDGWHRWCL